MQKSYSARRGIGAGIIGGIVAGTAMLVPMMSMMPMMNLPSNTFPTLIGMLMDQTGESVVIPGLVLHSVTSIIIGIIFVVITNYSKLTITGFKKGIPLGIATGIISFVVLFLPMIMFVFLPMMIQLMQIMNPSMSKEMIMPQLQSMLPMLLGGALFSHIVYGAVLGLVSSAILRKSN